MNATTRETAVDIESIELKNGAHDGPDDGFCAMELVSHIANEPYSDHPACACPVITSFTISLNDNWPHADRQRLKPFLSRIIGTRSTPAVETKRAIAALDWTMRVHRPLWLDAAGLSDFAAKLRELPEIVDEAGFALAMKLQKEALAAARAARAARDAWAAWAAWDARAARAARDAWAAWAAWAVRDAWAAWAARDARDARAAWDATGLLVAARAGESLGADATEQQRLEAGIAALNEVAARVRTAELELLERLIGVTA